MRKFITLSVALVTLLTSSYLVYADGAIKPDKNTPKPPVVTEKPPVVDPDMIPKGLIILNDFYAVDEKNVYVVNATGNAWDEIDADFATFSVIRGQFGRDDKNAFIRGVEVEGADMATFSVLSATNGYSRDAKNVYGPAGKIEGADPDTFKILTKNYTTDAAHVYFDGSKIEADSGSFAVIEKGLYASDANDVFYAGEKIENVSPEGFIVDGLNATAADGTRFVEGEVESDVVVNPEDGSTIGSLRVYWDIFQANILFWTVLILSGVGLWSMIFIFFAQRNDVLTSVLKVFLKSLISLIVTALVAWGLSHWISLQWTIVIASAIGLIFFLSMMSRSGFFKTLLITLLSLIVMVSGVALCLLFFKSFFVNIPEFLTFMISGSIGRLVLIAVLAVFIGTILIVYQLGSSLLSAFSQSLAATIIAVILVGFLTWIGDIGTLTSLIVFSILYGVLLWIMRFRMVSDLFVETVRVIRVALILAIIMGLIVWVVL